jgi:2-polyprenyl-3-methyl-5-hydroxy-6-metoxy-1,4-benzoquinol methylase
MRSLYLLGSFSWCLLMQSNRLDHWTRVYAEKAPSDVSWYQAEPEPSLHALDRLGVQPSSSLIDVGGGASNLVDALLRRGWVDVTVLDIAAPALEAVKDRLGSEAGKVRWEVADITRWQPYRQYDVWHDRAVFHFLTEREQREAYRRALFDGVSAGGLVIMATFAMDGPEKCSGLPVRRYDSASLAGELGPSLQLIDGWREMHVTPWGSSQSFNWCAFRRQH